LETPRRQTAGYEKTEVVILITVLRVKERSVKGQYGRSAQTGC